MRTFIVGFLNIQWFIAEKTFGWGHNLSVNGFELFSLLANLLLGIIGMFWAIKQDLKELKK